MKKQQNISLTTSTQFVLGASDPEMNEIERLLRQHDFKVILAEINGSRVHPGNAYKLDNVYGNIENSVFIECGCEDSTLNPARIIDHHRPGDAGFGRPAIESFEASSLGQLINLLGLQPTEHQKVIGACDHNLKAAYAGLVPSVSAESVINYRTDVLLARNANLNFEELKEKLALSVQQIQALPKQCFNLLDESGEPYKKEFVADATQLDNPIFEGAEASARAGIGLLYRIFDDRSERFKIGILNASEAAIRNWMSVSSVSEYSGLTNVYGDPVRGFAGAYELTHKERLAL